MNNVRLHLEEDMIRNDMSVFGNWQLEKTNAYQAVFSNKKNALYITYANRNPIELSLGVDLFYYNARFGSYVLIQYKRLNNEDEDKGCYYPDSDKHFTKQLLKMLEARKALGMDNSNIENLDGYRLLGDTFFFKFCIPKSVQPSDQEMVQGLNVPAILLASYIGSNQCLTENGARVVNKQRIRYLNNTDFTGLIREGWIGSSGIETNQIARWIDESLKRGGMVVLARSEYGE